MPTAPPVRWANWVAALFGIGAAIAVPQPQAYVVLASLLLVAVSGQWTLLGPSRHDHDA
jgi:4-amino-4-deoxy-L-arabinose transferase-like glycosyltransferase